MCEKEHASGVTKPTCTCVHKFTTIVLPNAMLYHYTKCYLCGLRVPNNAFTLNHCFANVIGTRVHYADSSHQSIKGLAGSTALHALNILGYK